jgi:hypothetical protein
MARGTRLTSRAGLRVLVLALLVLLLHVLALQWLAGQLQEHGAVLRPLPTPMFTRLLQPESPAALPTPAPAQAVAARPRRPVITALAKPNAKPRARPASAPEGAQAPVPTPAPALETSEPSTEVAAQPAADSAAQSAAEEKQPASTPETGAAAAPPPSGSDRAALDSWPTDTRLNYRLAGQFRSGNLHGSARVQWLRQDNRYETRVDIDVTLLASLVLTSQGEVSAQGLLPKAYEELRRSGPRGVRLGDETITLADGRGVPRPPGVQDTASQFVELSHRFATGQEVLEVGRSISFWMARPGGVDLWTYDIVERELLQTPQLGAVEAFHLKPRPIARPRGNITAELWFAPSLQYLPVRVRVNMGDAYVDLMVDKIEQR